MARLAAVVAAAIGLALGQPLITADKTRRQLRTASAADFAEVRTGKVSSGRCRGAIAPKPPGTVPGSVSARASGILTFEDCMAFACAPYPDCHYVSFSLAADACSTYSQCDVSDLEEVRQLNYTTLAVDPNALRPHAPLVATEVARVVDEMGAMWGACRSPSVYHRASASGGSGSNTTNSTTTPEGVEVTYSTVFTQVVNGRAVEVPEVGDPLGTVPGSIETTNNGIHTAMDCMRTACRPFSDCSYISFNAIGGECLTHKSCDSNDMVHVNRLGQDFVTLHRTNALRCQCRDDKGTQIGIGCGGPDEFPCPWTMTRCYGPGQGYCIKCSRALGYAEQPVPGGGCEKLVPLPQMKSHDIRQIVDRNERSMTAALQRIRARAHEAMQALEDARNGKNRSVEESIRAYRNTHTFDDTMEDSNRAFENGPKPNDHTLK